MRHIDETHPCHGPAKDPFATSKLCQSAPWHLVMTSKIATWNLAMTPIIKDLPETWSNGHDTDHQKLTRNLVRTPIMKEAQCQTWKTT